MADSANRGSKLTRCVHSGVLRVGADRRQTPSLKVTVVNKCFDTPYIRTELRCKTEGCRRAENQSRSRPLTNPCQRGGPRCGHHQSSSTPTMGPGFPLRSRVSAVAYKGRVLLGVLSRVHPGSVTRRAACTVFFWIIRLTSVGWDVISQNRRQSCANVPGMGTGLKQNP